MLRYIAICWMLCVAAVMAGAGCAAHKPATPQALLAAPAATPPGTGWDALPAPSTLPKGASTPPSEADRYRVGNDYYSTIPALNFSSGNYDPQWNPPGNATLADTAYAAYRFPNLAEYAGAARVRLSWDTPPADPADTWVALSNFERDRWDWFNLPGGEQFNPPSLAPYCAPTGELYAIVLLLGSAQAKLKYILVGDNWTPKVFISTDLPFDALTRIAPLSVTFDASASTSLGGAIASYDFDWEGDGTWDLTNEPDGIAAHTFGPGTYSTTIRARDNDGITGSAVLGFIAIDPANQAPVAQFTPTSLQGQTPLAVDLDPASASDPDGTLIKFEWDFNSDGAYDFSTDTPEAVPHVFGMIGVNTVTLRVTDNYLATDTVTHPFECITGWVTNVGLEAWVTEPIALAVFGSGADARPCVAYQEQSTLSLRFCKALTQTGSFWEAPHTPLAGNAESGYSPGLIMGIDGRPLISYGVHTPASTDYDLFTVHATNDSGSSWDPPVQVSNGEVAGQESSLLLLNSIPTIASITGPPYAGQMGITLYQCQDGNGSAWNAGLSAMAPAPSMRYTDICLGKAGSSLFKRPFISYVKALNPGSGELCSITATDLDGTAWSAPVVAGPIGAIELTHNLLVNGNPAIITGRPYQGGELYYTRAGDAMATSYPGGLADIGGGGYTHMVIFDGKPAACYNDFEGHDLWFVSADDVNGSSWGAPYQVDMTGMVGEYCRIALADQIPVIVYYDADNKRLKCAYLQLN